MVQTIPSVIYPHDSVRHVVSAMHSTGWITTEVVVSLDGVVIQAFNTGGSPGGLVVSPPLPLSKIGNNVLQIRATMAVEFGDFTNVVHVGIIVRTNAIMIGSDHVIRLSFENVTDFPITHQESIIVNNITHTSNSVSVPPKSTVDIDINIGALNDGVNIIISGGKRYVIHKLATTSIFVKEIEGILIFDYYSNTNNPFKVEVTNIGVATISFTLNASVSVPVYLAPPYEQHFTISPSVLTHTLLPNIPTIYEYITTMEASYFDYSVTINIGEQKKVTGMLRIIGLVATRILSLSPQDAAMNQNVTAIVELHNMNATTVTRDIHLFKDGSSIASKTVTLPPNAKQNEAFVFSVPTIGRYNIHTHINGIVLNVHGIRLTNLIITPAIIWVGGNVKISATATNMTTLPLTQPFTLLIDGVAEATQTITLNPGASTTLEFNVSRTIVKIYDVLLDTLFGRFEVIYAPAEFTVTNMHISPSQVAPDENVTIIADVNNIGGTQGTFTARLFIDGTQDSYTEVTVAPGGTQAIQFVVSRTIPKVYNVSLHGNIGTFKVLKPATFVMISLDITPTLANPDEIITIVGKVRNDGEISGTHASTLRIDGIVEATKNVPLLPTEVGTITFTTSRFLSKTYNVNLDGLLGTFRIRNRALIQLSNAKATHKQWNIVKICVDATNNGELVGSDTIEFRHNNNVIASETITLAPNNKTTVCITIEEEVVGWYMVEMSLIGTMQKLEVWFHIKKPIDPVAASINTKEEADIMNGLYLGNIDYDKLQTLRVISKLRIYDKI